MFLFVESPFRLAPCAVATLSERSCHFPSILLIFSVATHANTYCSQFRIHSCTVYMMMYYIYIFAVCLHFTFVCAGNQFWWRAMFVVRSVCLFIRVAYLVSINTHSPYLPAAHGEEC